MMYVCNVSRSRICWTVCVYARVSMKLGNNKSLHSQYHPVEAMSKHTWNLSPATHFFRAPKLHAFHKKFSRVTFLGLQTRALCVTFFTTLRLSRDHCGAPRSSKWTPWVDIEQVNLSVPWRTCRPGCSRTDSCSSDQTVQNPRPWTVQSMAQAHIGLHVHRFTYTVLHRPHILSITHPTRCRLKLCHARSKYAWILSLATHFFWARKRHTFKKKFLRVTFFGLQTRAPCVTKFTLSI